MAKKTNGNGGTNVATNGKPGVVTKMDAVRKAMAKLGWDTGRAQIREYVKAHFGIDMTADHVSTCRANAHLPQESSEAEFRFGEGAAAKPAAAMPTAVKAPVAKPTATRPAPTASRRPSPPRLLPRLRAKWRRTASPRPRAALASQTSWLSRNSSGGVGSGNLKTLIDAFVG